MPVVPSRDKTAIASLVSAATYRLDPSGLSDGDLARSSAVPSRHEPPFPVSLRQPSVPGGCASAPVPGSRENVATASLPNDAT